MHHFTLDADAATGEWDFETIRYLGQTTMSEHYARTDTYEHHYDHHDGGALSKAFWDVAGIEPTTENVALTIRFN